MKIGLLHPGEMGVSVGTAALKCGHEVYWLPAGRSPATLERASRAGFAAHGGLGSLLECVDAVISVCPPHGALDLAREVVDAGFSGVFVDANAVSPRTARQLQQIVGTNFVDGGIIGPPVAGPGTTRLYLSGECAAQVVEWLSDSSLDVRSIAGPPGAASALKMCYAAYTKGSSALLLAIRALAAAEGVTDALLAEWDISQANLQARSTAAARATAGKAWRFVGEMEEIAHTFEAQNLPGGFHEAAAEIFRRMSGLKDAADPSLEDALTLLNGK